MARSVSPVGPFTRYGSNPILSNNAIWGGPGHGGFTLDRDGTMWHLYHSRYVADPSFGRVQLLDRLLWTSDGWPTFGNNKTPSTALQNGPVVWASSGAGRITVSGGAGDDVLVISRNASDASLLDVRLNDVLVQSLPYDQVETLTLSAAGGNDTLVLDATRGNVIPGAGITVTGGGEGQRLDLVVRQ